MNGANGANGAVIPVDVEWAWWGKEEQDSRDYHLLQCSAGTIDQRTFAEQLARYSPGTLEELPQVSFSWIRDAQADGRGSHLAVVIRDALPRPPRDAFGREIVFARYFCMPYQTLAKHAVGLGAMYNAVRETALPPGDRQPIPLNLETDAADGVDAVKVPREQQRVAEVVAAQLLTTRPVCLTGGQRWSTLDRLRFLDYVMSLLPYGMRNQLSAATWVNSGFKSHRFRLYFAAEGRSGDDAQPGRAHGGSGPVVPRDIIIDVSPAAHSSGIQEGGIADKEARSYLKWVRQATRAQIAALGSMDTPVRLASKSAMAQLLKDLPGQITSVLELLKVIDEALQAGDERRLRETAANLSRRLAYSVDPAGRAPADSGDPADWREKARGFIRDRGLMRDGGLPDDIHGEVLDALVSTVAETPLTYHGYRQVAACAPSGLHPRLLLAMRKFARIEAIPLLLIADGLHYAEDPRGADERTIRLLESRDVRPAALLRSLAATLWRPGEPIEREDARVVMHVGLRYMFTVEKPRDFLPVLQERGYFAQEIGELYADPIDQVNRVRFVLNQAYGRQWLSRLTVRRILAPGTHPHPALYSAVESMTLWKWVALRAYARATTVRLSRSQRVPLPVGSLAGVIGLPRVALARGSRQRGGRPGAAVMVRPAASQRGLPAAHRAGHPEGERRASFVSAGRAGIVLLGLALVIVGVAVVLAISLVGHLKAPHAPTPAPPGAPAATSPRSPGQPGNGP